MSQLFTAGPRVGWVFSPQWTVYATGGYAQASAYSSFFAKGFPNAGNTVERRPTGWYAGGGIDYLITNWLYAGVEYRHIELDTEMHKTTAIPTVGAARFISPSVDLVQFRLGLKFSGF